MPNAIALRSDFTGAGLCGLARRRKDAAQARRLLALRWPHPARHGAAQAVGAPEAPRPGRGRHCGF